MKAYQVLQDCKFCCWELKDALEKNDQQKIRVQWVTCLTFLRMVGHVIDKVDKITYRKKEYLFTELWKEKKVDSIFLKFIEEERNKAIKQYELDIIPDVNEVDENVGMLFQDGGRFLTQSGDRFVFQDTRKIIQFSSKKDETGEKKRLDNWVEEAIEWWVDYLAELKLRINAT